MDFIHEKNRIAVYDTKANIVAEVAFRYIDDKTVDVYRTFVDDSLRGQGIAGKLMDELTEELRNMGCKARLSCSYAVSWFQKHTENSDVIK